MGACMPQLLLNCDMGESFGAWRMGLDDQVMPWIDCASIACGYHAGDPGCMRRTVALAAAHGVRIGAHPGYPDLQGFGRRSMACSPAEVEDMLLYQIGALQAICRAEGCEVSYVKPHGALYNDMLAQPPLLEAVLRAVRLAAPGAPLMLLAGAGNPGHQALAAAAGVPLWLEGFADRAYAADGALLPRSQPGAVYHDPERILAQALQLARGEPISTNGGQSLQLQIDSLCVHGDNPESAAVIRRLRQALQAL